MKVAIQGGYGSFHELAANEFFKEISIEVVPCVTFADLFEELNANRVDCGVVAVENSVVGSLLQNHSLILENNLNIVGEHYLRVIQNLIALPGEKIGNLKEIHSHPVAIMQCHIFLSKLKRKGVMIVDSDDTALSAKRIREKNLKGVGALASKTAAKMYNLEILQPSVEDNKRNFTRFCIVTNDSRLKERLTPEQRGVNKASLCFSLPHKSGKLSHVLSILSIYDMNLTKIQSLPIVGREWEYFFYTDLIFNEYSRYRSAIDAISPITENLTIIGEYREGKMP